LGASNATAQKEDDEVEDDDEVNDDDEVDDANLQDPLLEFEFEDDADEESQDEAAFFV
jgi:hypothetical protein